MLGAEVMADYIFLLVRYPITALLTVPRISWEAMKLHYKKKMPVYAKPNPSSDATIGLIGPSENQATAFKQARTRQLQIETAHPFVDYNLCCFRYARLSRNLSAITTGNTAHQPSVLISHYQTDHPSR
jgi:hypothetical protein